MSNVFRVKSTLQQSPESLFLVALLPQRSFPWFLRFAAGKPNINCLQKFAAVNSATAVCRGERTDWANSIPPIAFFNVVWLGSNFSSLEIQIFSPRQKTAVVNPLLFHDGNSGIQGGKPPKAGDVHFASGKTKTLVFSGLDCRLLKMRTKLRANLLYRIIVNTNSQKIRVFWPYILCFWDGYGQNIVLADQDHDKQPCFSIDYKQFRPISNNLFTSAKKCRRDTPFSLLRRPNAATNFKGCSFTSLGPPCHRWESYQMSHPAKFVSAIFELLTPPQQVHPRHIHATAASALLTPPQQVHCPRHIHATAASAIACAISHPEPAIPPGKEREAPG